MRNDRKMGRSGQKRNMMGSYKLSHCPLCINCHQACAFFKVWSIPVIFQLQNAQCMHNRKGIILLKGEISFFSSQGIYLDSFSPKKMASRDKR